MALSLVLRTAVKLPGNRFSILATCGSSNFSQASFTNPGHPGKRTVLSVDAPTLGVRNFGKSDFRVMWPLEKFLSLALVGLIPATIAYPSAALDNACAIIVGLHLHWGLEAVCQDYVRPIIFGNVIPKVIGILTYAFSIFVIGGLLYFNYNDVGIGGAVRKIWAIKQ